MKKKSEDQGKIKLIRCKKCRQMFEPIRRNSIIVTRLCISCFVENERTKRRKKQKSEIKEGLKTHSDWLNELQKIFNKYIRLRDKNKPCISCNKPLIGKYDAGHYFSVGSYPNLRFNENNVHGQCVSCNQHKHANIVEYSLQLPKRIGQEQFEALVSMKGIPLKLTTAEIKEKIIEYKQKIKDLN